MGREIERCTDDLSGVRGEHVLEDGRERLARAFLVALEREHHLVLVRGDEAVEGGLELGREEPADPPESALVWEEGDDELGGADLEVLEGVLLGGLHGGAGDDAARADRRGATLLEGNGTSGNLRIRVSRWITGRGRSSLDGDGSPAGGRARSRGGGPRGRRRMRWRVRPSRSSEVRCVRSASTKTDLRPSRFDRIIISTGSPAGCEPGAQAFWAQSV